MEPTFLTEMPEYKCHKVVRAAKVIGIEFDISSQSVCLQTELGMASIPRVEGTEYEVGGYLVCYEGGYLSYSPADAFENGYTALTDAPRSDPAIDALVNKFLTWRLPATVCSDTCVTDRNYAHPRSGTNLLDAAEARQMIEYLLADTPVSEAA